MAGSFMVYTLAIVAISLYAILCRASRYNRMSRNHAQFSYPTRDSFKTMTDEDAWMIRKYIFEYEFPFTAHKASEFALFRTYGIPSISSTLISTKQLSVREFASRRYADTEVLITEFTSNPPKSERANEAIARINYIHDFYRKSGQITDSDMLYTLGLFVVEPVSWISRYEWRNMSPMEVCALATFWKSIGDVMQIPYTALPSYEDGWTDGLHWFEELKDWVQRYEKDYMIPSESNHKTANETTAILLYDFPQALLPVGRNFVNALMDDTLRKAIKYDSPPSCYGIILNMVFGLRKFVLRYLMPPRPDFWPSRQISVNPDKNGRIHRNFWPSEPWYVKDNLAARYGPTSWMRWFMGLPTPGKGFKPEGYSINEVGPKRFENKGFEEIRNTKENLIRKRGGCPFSKGRL